MAAVVAMLAATSCDTEKTDVQPTPAPIPEPTPDPTTDPSPEEGYTEFIVSLPEFSSTGGSKVSLNSQGAWWEEGDYILVNGHLFMLKRDGDVWKALKQTDPMTQVLPVNGHFYCCYVGKSRQTTVSWDAVNCRYSNVDYSDMIPLAVATTSNKMIMYPCCAVIGMAFPMEFAGETNAYVDIDYDGSETNGIVGADCTIVPMDDNTTSIILGDEGDTYRAFEVNAEGRAYMVIPMLGNSVRINQIVFHVGDDVTYTAGRNGSDVVLQKGKWMNINFASLRTDQELDNVE